MREVSGQYPLGGSWDPEEKGRAQTYQSQRVTGPKLVKASQTTTKQKIHISVLRNLEAHSYTQ